MPWASAAIYWAYLASTESKQGWHKRYSGEAWYREGVDTSFVVPAGDLAFSVGIFLVCALSCLSLLAVRRFTLGFELGGPEHWKVLSASLLMALWIFYIAASAASSYGYFS